MRIPHLLLIALISLGLLYLLSCCRRRLPSWIVLLPGLIVIGAMAAVVATQCDDAYITYRYAQNIAAGYGPVYNPGERVEGYSSPLWMLLLTAGLIVGVPPTTFAPALAVVLLIALFLLLDRILIHEGVDSVWLRGLLPLTLGLSPAFAMWWFSGLEVPAYAVLIVAICWHLSCLDSSQRKSTAYVAALVALIVLIRPDGLLMTLVVLAYLLSSNAQIVERSRIRSGLRLLGPLLVVGVALTAFRLLYYDEWLPNTFYCKLGTAPFSRLRHGILYIIDQVRYLGGSAPFIVAAVGVLWARSRSFMKWGAVTILLYMGFFIYSGGDALKERFFVHITPLIYVIGWIGAAAVARRLTVGRTPGRWDARLLGLALLVLLGPAVSYTPGYKGEREFSRKLHFVATLLIDHVPNDFRLASCGGGIVPYRTGMPTIDMLGLCDKHIARTAVKSSMIGHQKWDGEYVVSRCPDLIITMPFHLFDQPDGLSNQPDPTAVNFVCVFNEIRSDPHFQQNYSRVSVPLADGKWLISWGHNRRDWQSLFPHAVIVPVATDS